jgi:homoserine dehydrogenase
MRIQLIGLGSIGKNLLKLISEKGSGIKAATGEKLEVVSVSDTTGTVITDGTPLTRIIQAKESGGLRTLDSFEKINAISAITDLESDLVVEITQSTKDGHPGINHILTAFENEKDVVTANKSVLVSDTDVVKKAKEMKRLLRYEATVCGGLPVFNLMEYCMKPAKIISVDGIFNATSTFVISQIEAGRSESFARGEATRLGVAEKDQRDDLGGIDSARKGVILHRRIFGSSLKLRDAVINAKENEIAAGLRQVTEVSPEGVKVEYRNVGGGSVFSNAIGPSMVIRFNTDIFDHLTLFTDHDGPVESAATILNDILLSRREKADQ